MRAVYGEYAPALIVLLRLPWHRMHASFFNYPHYSRRFGASAEGETTWALESVSAFRRCVANFTADQCALSFESLTRDNEEGICVLMHMRTSPSRQMIAPSLPIFGPCIHPSLPCAYPLIFAPPIVCSLLSLRPAHQGHVFRLLEALAKGVYTAARASSRGLSQDSATYSCQGSTLPQSPGACRSITVESNAHAGRPTGWITTQGWIAVDTDSHAEGTSRILCAHLERAAGAPPR